MLHWHKPLLLSMCGCSIFSTVLTGLWASIGITRSYSSRPFLCALGHFMTIHVHTLVVSVQELVHVDIYCAGCDVFLGLRSLPYKACPIFCVHHFSKTGNRWYSWHSISRCCEPLYQSVVLGAKSCAWCSMYGTNVAALLSPYNTCTRTFPR